jgi:hypothetical protein
MANNINNLISINKINPYQLTEQDANNNSFEVMQYVINNFKVPDDFQNQLYCTKNKYYKEKEIIEKQIKKNNYTSLDEYLKLEHVFLNSRNKNYILNNNNSNIDKNIFNVENIDISKYLKMEYFQL